MRRGDQKLPQGVLRALPRNLPRAGCQSLGLFDRTQPARLADAANAALAQSLTYQGLNVTKRKSQAI